MQSIFNLIEDTFKTGSDSIHLVDKTDSGDVIAICLTPDCLALSFDPFNGAKHNHAAVENAKTALNFRSEVDVPRRVDDVHHMFQPGARDGRGIDRDASSRLFRIKVSHCRAVIDVTHTVSGSGIKENSLCCCGFTRIDMSDNSNISNFINRAGHDF